MSGISKRKKVVEILEQVFLTCSTPREAFNLICNRLNVRKIENKRIVKLHCLEYYENKRRYHQKQANLKEEIVKKYKSLTPQRDIKSKSDFDSFIKVVNGLLLEAQAKFYKRQKGIKFIPFNPSRFAYLESRGIKRKDNIKLSYKGKLDKRNLRENNYFGVEDITIGDSSKIKFL